MPPPQTAEARAPSLFTALALLWLAGIAMRLPLIAVPPVIRLIHDDLHMTETQVGILIGIPLAMFALASIPGSLLIARAGAGLIAVIGLFVTSLASAGRAAAFDLWTLYAMTVLMGFGVAILHPALPTLVKQWMPDRVPLGTAVSSNGLMVGNAAAPSLTILLVLPLVGLSWRLDLLVWALPGFLTALLFVAVALRTRARHDAADATPRLWWPDWKNPLIWLLGITFGCNNAIYFTVSGFLPDYLHSAGRGALTGPALVWLNVFQFAGSCLLLATAQWLHQRVWVYLVFGMLPGIGALGIVLLDGTWVIIAASLIGFSLSITFVTTFALPPLLSAPEDVHRMAGGMFAISYTIAVIVPIVSGAIWDLTGVPWTAFLLVGASALILTTLGIVLTKRSTAQ